MDETRKTERARASRSLPLLIMGPWLEPCPLADTPLVVGRAEDCDLRLPAPTVSKHHVELAALEGGRVRVRDLASHNGTVVDGDLLRDGTVVRTAPTRLRVGPFSLLVTIVAPPGADTLTVGPMAVVLSVDAGTREAILGGQSLGALPPLEFCLLDALLSVAPAEISSRELGDLVWGPGAWDTYMLYNLVRRLRQRLTGVSDLVAIEAIRGRGYRLKGALLLQ